MARRVLVTGGNSGIGLALCKQLAAEDGCYVFMGSRSVERGQAALESLGEGVQDKIEVVALDVTDPGSIAAAKAHVEATGPLCALVNNAGCGLAHGVPAGEVIKTNLYGTVQMTEAFLPLLDSDTGRVVTVGSGAGPMWLGQQSPEDQAFFTDPAITWTAVDAYVQKHTGNLTYDDARDAYGVSKCALASWTVHLANSHPNLSCTSLSPGFIDTAIVAGWGATKPPEEGTVSIRHCLFGDVTSGHFFGSDAARSPFWPLRNPGQAPFHGDYPWSA